MESIYDIKNQMEIAETNIDLGSFRNEFGIIDFRAFSKEIAKTKKPFEEKIYKIQKINRILQESRIPNKVKDSAFNTIKCAKGAEKAFRVIYDIDKTKKWAYVWGANSIGKTILLGAATNMLANKLKSVTYFNEEIFFERAKSSFQNKEESLNQIVSIFKNSEYILWDEFSFLPYESNFELRFSYRLLEIAEESQKTIIFASNVQFNESIVNRIGQRNYARIKRNNLQTVEMKNKPYF